MRASSSGDLTRGGGFVLPYERGCGCGQGAEVSKKTMTSFEVSTSTTDVSSCHTLKNLDFHSSATRSYRRSRQHNFDDEKYERLTVFGSLLIN